MKSNWQPAASLQNIEARAHLLAKLRQFFAERKVMEVETPLLCYTSVTDPFIQSIPAIFAASLHKETRYYLQTSPEYAMKRLIAAGSGCIYQITKAFRQGEVGQYHNPEFTMIEWYRMQFDHHALMDEVDALLQLILQCEPAVRLTYAALFEKHLAINPHEASIIDLKSLAEKLSIEVATHIDDKDTWLNLLMTHHIEPQLGFDKPCFIYDFPASQAALARLDPKNPTVAARFEVYIKGMEIANGFHELQNATEQRKRFQENLLEREKLGFPPLPIDENFLAALEHGLPDCAGVALGFDRLLMLVLNANKITEVLSFDFSRV